MRIGGRATLHGRRTSWEQVTQTGLLAEAPARLASAVCPPHFLSRRQVNARNGIQSHPRWGSGRPMPVQPRRVRRMWSNPALIVERAYKHAHVRPGYQRPLCSGTPHVHAWTLGLSQASLWPCPLILGSDMTTRGWTYHGNCLARVALVPVCPSIIVSSSIPQWGSSCHSAS